MYIKVSMAIMSHLSDVQEAMLYDRALANQLINYVKMIVNEYPDTNSSVLEDDLNDLWVKCVERFPKK